MIDNPSNLVNIVPYHAHDNVIVENSASLPIIHVGTCHFGDETGRFSLNYVLVVPQMKKNLLFVSQLTRDYLAILNFMSMVFLSRTLGHTGCC